MTAESVATTSSCSSCSEPIVNRPNPSGSEVWCDLDGGSYGCLQRAFDEYEGERTTDEWGNPTFEPAAPYPPHLPRVSKAVAHYCANGSWHRDVCDCRCTPCKAALIDGTM